jgi:hypothetical protein
MKIEIHPFLISALAASAALCGAGAAVAAFLNRPKVLPAPFAPILEPTHYLALWMPTGELMACIPISDNLLLPPDAIRRVKDNPAAYDRGALAVYAVALTDNPDDMPPGFDPIYVGIGLPDGLAAAWVPT